jgi:predicted MFS family arabinose efflux permease
VSLPFRIVAKPSRRLTLYSSAVGSLLWLPFIHFWGRAPVLFWTTALGPCFTIGSAVVPTFNVYYGMRALTGVTMVACVVTGLTSVKDMFFFHEEARKIGIWAATFLVAPYLSAQLGNFIVGTGQWRLVVWMCVGVEVLALCLIVLLADETFYDRTLRPERQPRRSRRILRVVGSCQMRNHWYYCSIRRACERFVKVLVRPAVVMIMVY